MRQGKHKHLQKVRDKKQEAEREPLMSNLSQVRSVFEDGSRSQAPKRADDKLQELKDKLMQKREKNPFMHALQKAEWQQEQRERAESKRKNRKSTLDNHGNQTDDSDAHGGQIIDEDSLGAIMLQQVHLPKSSSEYFSEITTKIDTSEILEIVQVFAHQQNRQSGLSSSAKAYVGASKSQQSAYVRQGVSTDTNDYVVVVIKINSSQLRKFYGNGQYLVQVWRNKRRLFQHVHNYDIKTIYLNKTEIAYMINMPPQGQQQQNQAQGSSKNLKVPAAGGKNQIDSNISGSKPEPYDNHLNFIYVVQPFTQVFARILYPYEEMTDDFDKYSHGPSQSMQPENFQNMNNNPAQNPILFINDEYLIVAEGEDIKFAKTDKIFSLVGKRASNSNYDDNQLYSPLTNSQVPGFENHKIKKIKYFDDKTAQIFDPLKPTRTRPGATGRPQQSRGLDFNQGRGNYNNQNQNQDQAVVERQKCQENNKSLYGDLKAYEEGEREHIEFKCPLGRSEGQILAIDQTFIESTKGRRSQANQIVVYAAEPDSLNILIYRLNCDGDESEYDDLMQKQEAAPTLIDASLGLNIHEEAQNDFKLIGKYGSNQPGDKYVQMKVIHISDHQTLCVLKTENGHVDVIHDIMKNSQQQIYRFSEKIATEQKIYGNIQMIEFGSQKLHIQVQQMSGGQGSRRDDKATPQVIAYQFSVNMQTSKINTQCTQLPSLVTSMLDEDFFQHHVQIYDDMKLHSGMLILAHGQCVSLYNILKGNWVHYFNRLDCNQSNRDTRQISYQSEDIEKMLQNVNSNMAAELRRVLDRDFIQINKALRHQKSQTNFAQHCYFNRQENEIVSTVFQANDGDDYFEFLINQIGGTVRKVSLLFQKTLSRHLQSETFLEYKQQDDAAAFALDQLIEYSLKTPKIIAQQIWSEDGNLNREKQYMATGLFTQTNNSLFKEFGIFEQRLFLSTIDTGKSDLTQELFISEDCQQMKQLLTFEVQNARDISIIPVHNAKSNQLFVYSEAKRCLYVLKIEPQNDDDQQSQLTIGTMLKNNVICSIPNFEHRDGKLYFLEQSSLYFVKRGDLYEYNLITQLTRMYDFEKQIIDDCYFMMPGRHLYYRSRKNQINYVNLNWLYPSDHSLSKSQTNRSIQQYDSIRSQSSLYQTIEHDAINNDVAAFVDPSTILILPDLGLSSRVCRGSLNFDKKFIGTNIDRSYFINKLINSDESAKYNIRQIEQIQHNQQLQTYLCPSEYVAKICALDCQSNTIKVWSVGTGKLLGEHRETTYDFKGFIKHEEWNGSTLVYIDRLTLAKKLDQEKTSKLKSNELSADFFENRLKESMESRDTEKIIIRKRKVSQEDIFDVNEFDTWRKISIFEDRVSVEKEFQHNLRPGSKLYVSQRNDLIAEFQSDTCFISSIKSDNQTRYLTEFKMNIPVSSPVYFTKDFRRHIRFEYRNKDSKNKDEQSLQSQNQSKSRFIVTVYQVSEIGDNKTKIKTFSNYEPLKDIYMPDFDDIKKNAAGHPYIFFKSNDTICYIDQNNVEQCVPLMSKSDLLADQSSIQERYLPSERLTFRTFFDSLNFRESQLRGASDGVQLLQKSLQVQEFNNDLKKINDLRRLKSTRNSQAIIDADRQQLLSSQSCYNYNMVTYRKNNLRYMQSFSYDNWRTIELIATDRISIDELQPQRLAELLRVILPNGLTLINILVQRNLNQLEKLIHRIIWSRNKGGGFIPFELVPDIRGSTALHECVQNTYTKASEEILDIAGKNPLGNHIEIIQDILPDLVETCPMAVSKYFSDRMIECPWTLKHTKGDLKKADEDVGFGVYSDPLIHVDIDQLESKLFESESYMEKKLDANKEQKHLPMVVKVFDFPKLHHFGNHFGRRMMAALSESDDTSIFDRPFVQAILEYQWPAVRQAIISDLLLPYVVFFAVFNYYALYWFEKEDKYTNMVSSVEGIFIRVSLVLFCIYFCFNEYTQFQNESSALKYLTSVWNYIDLIPNIPVLCALAISVFNTENEDLIKLQRYLHAIASFFICIKLLYFLRIFRMYGHLIKTIVEVIVDMKVFMVILLMSLITFAGSFFILAQNNKGDDVFTDSYIDSLLKLFELMLGAFDTEKFQKSVGSPIVYFTFALSALFLIVIMLNLLIAIISDTFANAQSQSKRKMYQEFAQLIFESQHLLTDAKKQEYDRQGNYLFISEIHLGGGTSPPQGQASSDTATDMAALSTSATHIEGPAAFAKSGQNGSTPSAPTNFSFSDVQMRQIQQILKNQIENAVQNLKTNGRAGQKAEKGGLL